MHLHKRLQLFQSFIAHMLIFTNRALDKQQPVQYSTVQ